MELQPIETAPKDGTWVLLFGGMADAMYANDWLPDEDLYRPAVAFWDECGKDSSWVYANYDGQWGIVYKDPTHWLSLEALPTPPVKGRDEANQQAARDAWQMQEMFGKEENPGLQSDPLTDEEVEGLRKLRDWTPPRTADDKIH